MKITNFTRFFPLLVFIFVALYVTRGFLFKTGYILYGEYIGSLNYWGFLKKYLSAWSDYTSLGHSNIGFPTRYGVNPTYFIGSVPFINRWLIFQSVLQIIFPLLNQKLYLIGSLACLYFGFFYLAKYWFTQHNLTKKYATLISVITSLIYAFNAQTGIRLYAGHITYNYGYGLFPLLILFLLKSLEEKNNRRRVFYILLSSFIFSILFWLMPHLLYILIIILTVYIFTIIRLDLKLLSKLALVLIINGFVALLLNIDAWLPNIFYKESYPLVSDTIYTLGYYYQTTHGASLMKILQQDMLIFEKIWAPAQDYSHLMTWRLLIPVIALLGFFNSLFLKKNLGRSLFLIITTILGLIFCLGPNPPFEKINLFLYKNVFLFKPFRDPSKFFMVYMFGVSLLSGYFFITISKLSRLIFFLLIFIFPFFAILTQPLFFSGNFGTIHTFKYPEKYLIFDRFLSKQKDKFRVAYFPNNHRVSEYDWYSKNITSGSPYYNVFTAFQPLSKSLANSNRTITDHSSRYLEFLEHNFNQNWAIQRLINEKVKYFVVDRSYPDHLQYIDFFANSPLLTKVKVVDGLEIYQAKKFNPDYLEKVKAAYYFGNISGIGYLPTELGLIDLGWNNLDKIRDNLSDTLILYDSSVDDVFLTSLKSHRVSFFPEVRFTPGSYIIPGEYLLPLIAKGVQFYNPEMISTDHNLSLSKKINLDPGNYLVFASFYSDPNTSRRFSITISGSKLSKPIPQKKAGAVVWVSFGKVKVNSSRNNITLTNEEDKSIIIDSVLLIPEKEYQTKLSYFTNSLKNKNIIEFKKNSQLNTKNIRSPHLYRFSQSFSPYWQMSSCNLFQINFYGMGFYCPNSRSTPFFIPKTLYLIISIISIFFHCLLTYIFLYIIKFKKHENRN